MQRLINFLASSILSCAGITLSANLRTGAQVAPLRRLILRLRHGQKQKYDTIIFKRSTDRLLWPGLTENYDSAGREL